MVRSDVLGRYAGYSFADLVEFLVKAEEQRVKIADAASKMAAYTSSPKRTLRQAQRDTSDSGTIGSPDTQG